MISYRGLLEDATRTLYEASDTPRIDAEYLLLHVTNQSMAWLISYGDCQATSKHLSTFYALIEQRAKGVPVAYLMGYRDFWTLQLQVNEHVLIPRGDTEVLVEQALARLDKSAPQRIADLGTGSGAIALSLAKELPTSSVVAVDLHAQALAVAQQNAIDNQIANVEFRQASWLNGLENETFDLIASNPPYVDAQDPHLQQGDLRFEPDSALIADDNGMADLQTIITGAVNHLCKDGWLLLEHGYNQAEAVGELLNQTGFENIELYADLNHLPRCTAAQWRAP